EGGAARGGGGQGAGRLGGPGRAAVDDGQDGQPVARRPADDRVVARPAVRPRGRLDVGPDEVVADQPRAAAAGPRELVAQALAAEEVERDGEAGDRPAARRRRSRAARAAASRGGPEGPPPAG